MSNPTEKPLAKTISGKKGIPKPSEIKRDIPRRTLLKKEIPKPSAKIETQIQKPETLVNKKVVEPKKMQPNKFKANLPKQKEENQVFQKKKITNDRRGISEIKRSESNLQEKINVLENELLETKQSLVNMNFDVEEKNEQVLKMEKELQESKNSNQVLINLLENENIDPITQTKRDVSLDFKSLMETKKENSKIEATELLLEVKNINSFIEQSKQDLQNLEFNFNIPE